MLDESWKPEDGSGSECLAVRMAIVNKRRKLWLWILLVLLLAVVAVRLGCGKPKPPPRVTEPTTHAALDAANRYDLVRDETRGGHTLERHVAKNDAELRERLQNEDISSDSTYSDRAIAEMAVAAAIRENSSKINRWLHRPGGHSNLVLDYDSGSPVGKSMRRGEARSFPCSHAVAILKFVSASDYYVLTSYPDCWKQQ